MKLKYILSIAAILLTLNIMAQNTERKKNSIGFSDKAIYLSGPDKIANGICIHYNRRIKDSNFGIGANFDHVFGDYSHSSVGVVAHYEPLEGWEINVSPGITFEDDETKFSAHFEMGYGFKVSVFEIGPSVAYSTDFEDYHLGVGMHIGYGF